MIEFIVIFLGFYVWHCLGVTVGYHRLLSHRSFTCGKAVEYFFVLGGYLAFEGAPIWWATVHRAHHRYVDTPLDPHSPRNGVSYAHLGWLWEKQYPAQVDPQLQSKDLITDPFYLFLEQNGDLHRSHFLTFLIGITLRLIILVAFGWVPALASILACVLVWQIPLMLNVVCHIPKFGYKNYATTDDSVNVWWVGILAMGEGWHNNHHASPASAKTGMRFWELDVSWWVIKGLEKLGLVRDINVQSHRDLIRIDRARRNHAGNSAGKRSELTGAKPRMKQIRARAQQRGKAAG